jgi:signal transduction histidine kinase
MFRDATSRLIAIHLILVALSTLLVLGFVYWRAGGVIDSEMRQVVEAEARSLSEDYLSGGAVALSDAIERRIAREMERDAVYLFTTRSGRRVAGNLRRWPESVTESGWTTLDLFRTDAEAPTTISALALSLPRGERLLVGRDVAARAAFDQTLFRALLWGLLGMAGLSLATGWLLSRLVLRRIGDLAGAAKRITTGALSERAPIRGSGDEFDRLAAALNAMLDRNAALVADLRLATDALAHDIRSPLGRLLRILDAADADMASPDERRAHLDRARVDAQTVLDTATALLEISRIEGGLAAEQFGSVDLATVARDVAELYEAAAEDRGIRLRCDLEPALVRGHAQLLAQAVANLLDNAMRHGGGDIAIHSGVDSAGAGFVAVRDRGPGIPSAERARVLERFVRLDQSRVDGGAGLGLALVKAVAKTHGGSIELRGEDPGLSATLSIPNDGAAWR